MDQAMMLQSQAETYTKQHEEMHKRLTVPEKTMLVCDICGVFINSTDNDQRRRVSGGRWGTCLAGLLHLAPFVFPLTLAHMHMRAWCVHSGQQAEGG